MKAEVSGGGDFQNPKPGVTIGRCYGVIDLGTQMTSYGAKHKILIQFELPTQLMERDDEKVPMMVSKQYTLSFNSKANLRKDMEAWYGKKFNDKDIEQSGGFDPSKVVGKPAQLLLEENDTGDKVYINIATLMPLAEGQSCPEQVNPSFVFDLDEFSLDKWDTLSEKMKQWIAKSPEAQQALGNGQPEQANEAVVDDGFNDLPF